MLWAKLIPYKEKILISLGVLILLSVTHTSVYFIGRASMGKAQAKAEVKVLKDELKDQDKVAKQNAAEGERVGRESAEMEARIERALEELNEAIERAGIAGCSLSDDELRGFEALRDSYK